MRQCRGPIGAGQDRHLTLPGKGTCAPLVAECLENFRRGADEDQPGCSTTAGEVGVFAEEPVTGVNGVAARLACDIDDLCCVEVSSGTRARQPVRRIRFGDMVGLRVIFRIDCMGTQARFGSAA